MALTYTPDTHNHTHCPNFALKGMDEKKHSLNDFNDSIALVVLFICNHCPYVKAIESRIIQLAQEMKNQGIQFIAICSNDPNDNQEDSFKNLQKNWQDKNFNFPYLIDETQQVAKDFGAVCTPYIFVYENSNGTFPLFYRGRLDDSWKNESLVKKQELKEALLNILEDQPLPQEAIPSMGCSIKWIES